MQDLLEEIERAVRRRGWSARQASIRAVGTPELIRDMRRGRVPSVERFRALCEVLDLEFYVGRPRIAGLLNQRPLEEAIEIAENALAAAGMKVRPADKAGLVYVLYAQLLRDASAEAKSELELEVVEAARIGQLRSYVSRP